jgi:hypothetical protein
MKDRRPPVRRKSPQMNNNLNPPMQNEAALGRDVQHKIGEQLRAVYDDVVNQGVPDRFAELLKRLDDREGGERS